MGRAPSCPGGPCGGEGGPRAEQVCREFAVELRIRSLKRNAFKKKNSFELATNTSEVNQDFLDIIIPYEQRKDGASYDAMWEISYSLRTFAQLLTN